MKLFFYYAFCSVKNQIKKLCRSWFIIFLIVCMLLGGIIGLGVGFLSESLDDSQTEEQGPAIPDDAPPDELTDSEKKEAVFIIECIVASLTLLLFFFAVLFADKGGSSIFIMPDVNLLFAAPMKPQSVLLFRLMSQILITFFASIYFVFQIPSVVIDLGLGALSGVVIILAWIFILVYQKLITVLVYTLASTHARVKKYLRPAAFAVLFILAGVYLLMYMREGDFYGAYKAMFASAQTRYIPIYGWIKGLVVWSAEGEILKVILSLVLLSVFAVGIAYAVWRIKADFYEEAMQKSEKTAESLAALQENSAKKRAKERPDKILRDGLCHGSGANVFFFKSIYNRKRFSHLGLFTKTSEFYLFLSVTVALILRFAVKTTSFLPIGLGLCACVFFRSLGNPLSADMEKSCFITVPASAHEKVLWSLLSGTVDCALDILPAALVSAVIIGASPLEVMSIYLLALSIDFYATNVMLFIEFSLPSSIALQMKQAISILFIYFGLIPIAAVIAAGAILGLMSMFLLIASFAAILIGALFFVFSPIFIEKGRK